MKFSIREEADAEMVAAAERYQREHDGLGYRFLDAVGEAIQLGLANPRRWPIHPASSEELPAHYIRVKDFP